MKDRPLELESRLGLSAKEAAQALGVSERHFRRHRSEIPCVYIGKRVVFPVASLREYLAKEAKAERSQVDRVVSEVLSELGGGG